MSKHRVVVLKVVAKQLTVTEAAVEYGLCDFNERCSRLSVRTHRLFTTRNGPEASSRPGRGSTSEHSPTETTLHRAHGLVVSVCPARKRIALRYVKRDNMWPMTRVLPCHRHDPMVGRQLHQKHPLFVGR